MILRAITALVLTLSTLVSAQAQPIKVDGGLIEGVSLDSGVDAWLGVPFAAPPLRELRWMPPQEVKPWSGIFHVDRYAPECLQPLRSPRQNHYFGNEPTSEDCLYLNIWAPDGARNKLPVLVWIYGGGFNIGSASMANYSGEPLAKAGVIRVNIAYRVGALGFLSHPELSRESGHGASGNYGLMDQIAALKWVKRNIAGFGGDPENVTIVGQSAGSMSVALLQQSSEAKGLFQRAIGMSGSPFGGMIGPVSLEKAEAQGMALQRELGATTLADMRAIPGDLVIAAKTPRDPIVLDGQVLIASTERTFAARRQNDVPLLIGFTRDESFRPFDAIKSDTDLANAVSARYSANAEQILSRYQGSSAARRAADIARDATVGLQMGQWASAQQRYGSQPVYAYLFARRHPYAVGITFSDHDPATVGAYHTGDVPYWLRTRDSLNMFRQTRVWEPGDVALENEMSAALLAFARTGTPTSPSIGRWPSFDPAHPRLVRLDIDSQVIGWPHYSDYPLLIPEIRHRQPDNRQTRD